MAGGEKLRGRICRVLFLIPVATPGDYTHTTRMELEINGGDDPSAPGLWVTFKAKKTLEKEPNTAEIVIFNLNEDSMKALQVKGVRVIIEAGYKETGFGRIFSGDVRTIDHVRDGAHWQTKVKAGDGERSFRFARLSESFSPGTGAGDILKRLANASGLALGNVPTQALSLLYTFEHGYAVTGRVSDSIDRLVRSLGYSWSVQDGLLQILAPSGVAGPEVPEDSPETGLIGSPEMGTPEKKGHPALLKYKRLILPCQPGQKRLLKSERYNGFLRVKKCEFEGDTAGGAWYVTIEGILHGQ